MAIAKAGRKKPQVHQASRLAPNYLLRERASGDGRHVRCRYESKQVEGSSTVLRCFPFAENGRLIEENHHYVAVRERVGLLYRRDDLTFWPAGQCLVQGLKRFNALAYRKCEKADGGLFSLH
jgi:hypothetical protein